MGVCTPEILGEYSSDLENFLFAKEVKGKEPNHFFKTHREEIIRQDADMLSKLCCAGYMKQGFCDFDDKIFDGKKLYLIDADELLDIYSFRKFRDLVANPLDSKKIKEFRVSQIQSFKKILKDAISCYFKDKSLLMNEKNIDLYINSFYKSMKWGRASRKEKKYFKDLGNHMTEDEIMSLHMDR